MTGVLAYENEKRSVTRDSRLSLFLVQLFAACVIFYLWMPIEVLNPLNTTWALNYDWGTNYLGFRALCIDEWQFPIAWTKLGLWTTGFSIAFSDSIPLLSLPLKMLRGIIGCHFQFLEPFLFASLLLQIIIADRIFRASGWAEGRLVAALLVCLFPPLFHRYYHVALTAHWLILLCILGLINARCRTAYFFVVSQLCIWINMYFLPVAVFFAAITRTYQTGSFSVPVLMRSVLDLAVIAAGSFISLWLLGFFDMDGVAAGFGYFSMNLLGPINPAGYSRFLPDLPIAGEGQIYEGFQYLGLGYICALLVNIGLLAFHPSGGIIHLSKTRTVLLIGAVTIFALIALSNKVYLGDALVLNFDLPYPVSEFAVIFRTGGRYFWVVAYVAIIFVLLHIRSVLPTVQGTLVITALAVIQLLDVKIAMPVFPNGDTGLLMTRQTARSVSTELQTQGIRVVEIGREWPRYSALVDDLIERKISLTQWYVARPPKDHIYPATDELLNQSGAFVSARHEECAAKAETTPSARTVYGDGFCFLY